MSDRWFSDDELEAMSRPVMDRATEAIDRGDLDEAKRLCEEMKYEGQFMHDMLVDGIAGLISYIQDKLGDDGVEESPNRARRRHERRAAGGPSGLD